MSDKPQRLTLEPGEWVRWGCSRCNWSLPTSCLPDPPPYDECPICRLKGAHSAVVVTERGMCQPLFTLADRRKQTGLDRKPPPTSKVGTGGSVFDAKPNP
jgi:hypothetical protein